MQQLQQQMQNLTADLQQMHATQAEVRAAQVSIETMQLHSRLSWVLYHSSHLPQMRLAWEEIALLPSLNETQRQQAKKMLVLSQQRLENVSHWQQELSHIADTYQSSAHSDVLPQLFSDISNPWLQWVFQQFSIKRAETDSQIANIQMRNRLLKIRQDMGLEQWPDAASWTRLRSELQMHMLQVTSGEKHAAASQQLLLPENFHAIQQDIQRLQQTARDWLKES